MTACSVLHQLIHSEGRIELLHHNWVAVAFRAEVRDLTRGDLAPEALARVVGQFLALLRRVTAMTKGASEARPRVDIVGESSRGRRDPFII